MKTDHFERGMTADFAVRYMIVDCSSIAQIAQKKHNLEEISAKLSTEGIIASYLLASHIKGEEKLTIQILSQEPKVSFLSDVSATGDLRAQFSPSKIAVYPDQLDGVIVVIKHNKSKELYRGVTDIKNLSISQALQRNLAQSEQVDSIVHFCISTKEGQIDQAIGIILERLPQAKDLPYLNTEEFHAHYADLSSNEIFEGIQQKKIRSHILHELSQKTIHWKCQCSRAKIKSMLFSLGKKELQTIQKDIGMAEVTCHFCNDTIVIAKDELQELIDQYN